MNPLVQSFLDRFTDSTIKSIRTSDGFADYQTCLHSFWNGQLEKTVEHASSILSANPDHGMRFSLYRLWIEALSSRGEKLSLHALQEHLLLRGQASPGDRATWMALRGIIHLELDRPNAASLMLRATGHDTKNPWVMELAQTIELRTPDSHDVPALIHTENTVPDYVVWTGLVRGFVAINQRHRAETCFDIMDRIFTGNPLKDTCYFHWTSELGDWSSAMEHATHLASTFPDHPDFAFFAALAAFKLNRFNQAVNTLDSAKSIRIDSDADATLLMGQALKQLGMQKQDPKLLDRALAQLKRASHMMSQAGVSPMLPEQLIQEIQETLAEASGSHGDGGTDESTKLFRPTRAWLVKLSARRYQELKASRESHIERLVRPMGGDAQPGDLCFFAVDLPEKRANRQRGSSWKIAAIYTVDSAPVWHPQWKYQSALQLFAIPKKMIAVDINIMDSTPSPKTVAQLPKGHPFRYGVFQLEEGALDLIQEALKQHQAAKEEHGKDKPAKPAV